MIPVHWPEVWPGVIPRIPGKTSETDGGLNQVRQFLDNSKIKEEDDFNGLVTLFEAGLKWNTHVYCVPDAIDSSAPELVVTKCTREQEQEQVQAQEQTQEQEAEE